jgi:hypothetical protein
MTGGIRKLVARVATTSAAAVVALTLVPLGSATAEPSVQSQLSSLRNATAAYHSLSAAEADGFVPLLGCFDNATLGGMGQHFFIPSRMGVVSLNEPTALVYEPHDGRYNLVAVEYIVPGPADMTPPHLLGRDFTYLSALGVWKLHAWIYRPNPAGMFADYNSSVRACPTG